MMMASMEETTDMTGVIEGDSSVSETGDTVDTSVRQLGKHGLADMQSDSPPKKKKKKKTSSDGSVSKNALQTLNEMMPGLQYNCIGQTGPDHRPTFTVQVEVNGQVFEGEATSKKQAMHAAAQQAVQVLAQQPVNNDDGVSMMSFDKPATSSPTSKVLAAVASGKSALMIINEVYHDVEFSVEQAENGDGKNKSFVASVHVAGETYQGSGRSKQLAKGHASAVALSELHGVTCFSSPEMKPVIASDKQADMDCLKLADHIASLVADKFSELSDQLKPDHARRKVLAGVVMTSSSSSGKVICVTTGTKCIGGDHLSDSGSTVNDCHAEILARRCLCRFLYQQIQHFTAGSDSVFIPSESGTGFALKPGVEFHLYISSAPCGDARIFSPHEAHSKEMRVADDAHPNRITRGQLRTKIESGEGSIPVQSSNAGMQTWDGIMLGERLLTMSCSDKLARMNVLGLQGALLSLLVEPIYWSSIVIGSLYHHAHIRRALFDRINMDLESLPVGYCLHQPMLSPISQPETRVPQKAPSLAVVWCVDCVDVEVISESTGKLLSGQPSQLCKAEMFRLFADTWNLLNSGQEFPAVYSDVKRMADDYQAAKISLYRMFKEANLGCWMEKPMEQDNFVLSKSLSADTDAVIPDHSQ